MKIERISNFAKAGLNTDIEPYALPGNFITNIRNVRIKNSSLTPFGGYAKLDDIPFGFEPGLIMHTGKESTYVLSGSNGVFTYSSAGFADVTPIIGVSVDKEQWFGCNLSGIPILNNNQLFPIYSPDIDSSAQFQLLPWDATRTWQDVNERCLIIRSHKQFLFALGIFTGGEFFPESVRWSAPADVGLLPDSWDHLDTTNVAGLVPLSGSAGSIIDGLSLRDSFVVYRERGITIFDYVGGSFVWQIRNLSTTFGCISPRCIAEVNGKHYFIGDGDIFINDGNSVESILYGRIKDSFTLLINSESYTNSFVVNNKLKNEIWFCIPTGESKYPNLAYIYNWKEDSWTTRDLPEVLSVDYGPKKSNVVSNWESDDISWEALDDTWDNLKATPLNNTLIGITPSPIRTVVQLDDLDGGSDIEFDYLIERVDYIISESHYSKSVNRVYPRAQGIGSFNVQIGSNNNPGSEIKWSDARPFDVAKDRKFDVRSTGMLHSFRFYGKAKFATFTISGIDFDYIETGQR